MKIVGPNRQAVQSLGRHSVGNTGFEGEAQLAKVMGDVGQNLAIETAELMTHRQVQKAGLAAQEAQTQFDEKMSGQIFFNVDELPGDIVTPAMRARPDGRVVRAEVEPALYKKHMQASLKQISKSIDLPGPRGSWENRMRTHGLNHLEGLQNKAQTEMKRQFFEGQKADWEKAVLDGNWGQAIIISEEMYATEEQKAVYKLKAKQGAEGSTYQNAMATSDVPEITDAIAFLSQEEEDYAKAGGELNNNQRLGFLHSLNSTLDGLTADAKAGIKVQRDLLNYRIKTEKSNASKGMRSSVIQLNTLYADVVDMHNITNDYAAEILEIEDTMMLSYRNDEMILMPRSKRRGYSQLVPDVSFDDEMRSNKLRIGLETSNDAMVQKENVDAMQAWSDAGFFGQDGISPIDFGDPKSIAKRMSDFKRAQTNYNFQGQGMLTSAEAKEYSQQWDSLSVKDQLSAINNTTDALGPESTVLFQQLASEGNAGSLSVAGVSLVNNDVHGARNILEGREYRKRNWDRVSEFSLDKDIKSRIHKEFPTLYSYNSKKQETTDEAIFDAYIGIVKSTGNFNGIDVEAYNEAVRIAVGGIFTHGGNQLPNPERGMPEGTMETWIQSTSFEYVERTSGAPVYVDRDGSLNRLSTQDFWSDVQDGKKYTLTASDQHDEYHIIDENRRFVQSSTGDAFRVRYDAASEKYSKKGFIESIVTGDDYNRDPEEEEEEQEQKKSKRNRFGRVMR